MIKDINPVKGGRAVPSSRAASLSCNSLKERFASPGKLINAVFCHFDTPSFVVTRTNEGPMKV